MAYNEESEETISRVNELEVPKTAENEEGGEAITHGNDWEMVSLTASTYAAAPGPREVESVHESNDSTVTVNDEAETSQALFMSGHFGFPPSQHDNLPVSEKTVLPKGVIEDDLAALLKEGKSEEKIDEKWRMEGLDVNEEFPSISLFEKKGHMKLSSHGPQFDEPITGLRLNVDDKEHNLYEAAYDGSAIVNDVVEASVEAVDSSSLKSKAPKSVNEDEADESELPCGAWWKRGLASFCDQAKEAGAFWSIFVAAAVMGLVVLGQRWQQERWQILHQRSQLSIADEKSGRILSGLKDVIVGGSHRGTYVTAASAEL